MGDARTVPAQIQSALPPEALRVYRAQRWTTAGCRCAPRRRCVTWRQSQRRWRLRRRACQRSRLSARRHATTTSRSRRRRCVCGRSAHHARTTCDVQRLTPPQRCSSRCVPRKRRARASRALCTSPASSAPPAARRAALAALRLRRICFRSAYAFSHACLRAAGDAALRRRLHQRRRARERPRRGLHRVRARRVEAAPLRRGDATDFLASAFRIHATHPRD